jgi:protein required for attachment to host cells
MRKVITWILVADAARGRIFENDGPGRGVKAAGVEEFEGENLRSRDINADRPGRSFDSTTPKRSAYEPPTDPQRHAKHEFMRELAQALEAGLNAKKYDRLILVAPPQALGDLRSLMSQAVKAKVIAELNKDLTKTPEAELPRHLGEVLAV